MLSTIEIKQWLRYWKEKLEYYKETKHKQMIEISLDRIEELEGMLKNE